ncbi:hypothetical protein B0T17DRAFT_519439 [Bombardia bombarda]|uniref:Secreted protein n=1 Tax=Bombardia bombarda TaxID=252184 RepID=A0AA40CGE3_9PEZI|nr:hypothetical protein B0T17DRAFT_519439 [Bombardia bombarda]
MCLEVVISHLLPPLACLFFGLCSCSEFLSGRTSIGSGALFSSVPRTLRNIQHAPASKYNGTNIGPNFFSFPLYFLENVMHNCMSSPLPVNCKLKLQVPASSRPRFAKSKGAVDFGSSSLQVIDSPFG